MKSKRPRSKYVPIAVLLCAVALPVLFFLVVRFEGEKPALQFRETAAFIGTSHTLEGTASDHKSGLRRVWIAIFQQGKERVIFEQTFPAKGFLRGSAVESVPFSVDIEAKEIGLVDGEALLRAAVWDFSCRGWFGGNQTYAEHKVIIDTRPPVIDVVSRAHNVNVGGAGLAVYRLLESCPVSGVEAGGVFFPGHPGFFSDPNLYIAFFALAYDRKPDALIQVTAEDDAGNTGRGGLAYHISAKQFKHDTLVLSDNFLKQNLPELSRFLDPSLESAPPIDRFLAINTRLRAENHETLKAATQKSDKALHWEGSFLRLPNSARKAGFADHRRYEYQGNIVDEQVHLGIDLASTAQAAVPAANHGRVALADYVGIYGNAVILDHGFGLFSMYGHLSRITVQKDQMVAKGDVIGHTGTTGLAGGDHLHFSMMVGQTFVNPIEWWDASWIANNVTSKLAQAAPGVEE